MSQYSKFFGMDVSHGKETVVTGYYRNGRYYIVEIKELRADLPILNARATRENGKTIYKVTDL
jgi:hypothetical protein